MVEEPIERLFGAEKRDFSGNKNPNYRGITLPFWHSLAAVGQSDTFRMYGTPYCGKGEPNQMIRVGHASPTCLFKNIEVFGGAR